MMMPFGFVPNGSILLPSARSAVTATSDHAPTIRFAMFSSAAAARENETLAIRHRHKIVDLITDPSSNFLGEISVSRCKSLALAAGAANEKWTKRCDLRSAKRHARRFDLVLFISGLLPPSDISSHCIR